MTTPLDTAQIPQSISEYINKQFGANLIAALKELYSGTVTGYLEIRAFHDSDRTAKGRTHWLPLVGLDESQVHLALDWCEERAKDGYGVYIAYNPRKSTASGARENVVETLPALYVDCDYYKIEGATFTAVLDRADELQIKPSIVVNSGGGAQFVYLIEPCSLAEWHEAQNLLYSHFQSVGADHAIVADWSRVLRLPGFPNQKKGGLRKTECWIEKDTWLKSRNSLVAEIRSKVISSITEDSTNVALEESLVPTNRGKGVELPGQIHEGGTQMYEGRNAMLFKIGCKFRDIGFQRHEIEYMVAMLNEQRCVPPLDRSEVLAIVDSVCRYTPTSEMLEAANVTEAKDLLVTLGAFKVKQFPELKKVLYGLHRGEVGMTQARPNIGKTTLWTNVAMSVACGRPFPGIYEGGEPLRVVYIDKENVPQFVKSDYKVMQGANFDEYERDLIDSNLVTMVDPHIGKDELDLANAAHLALLEQALFLFDVDLVIVDTLTAAFGLTNENDNSEMERKVNKPLKELAKKTDSAIMVLHHIGKGNEFANSDKLYRGRGASSLAAMCRLVFDMDMLRDTSKQVIENHVVLHTAKVKGQRQDDVTYELQFSNRWFAPTNVGLEQTNGSLSTLLDIVTRAMTRIDIVEAMAEYDIAPSTTDKLLKQAIAQQYLEQTKRGIYAPKTVPVVPVSIGVTN